MRRGPVVLAAGLVALLGSFFLFFRPPQRMAPRPAVLAQGIHDAADAGAPGPFTQTGSSNILPADYVGPSACASCHAAQFTAWSQSAHSKMNQNPSGDTVMADFGGAHIAFQGGEVTFDRDGDAFQMTLTRGGTRVRSYRVTRTVGSRFMQFFIGKQVTGPEPRTDALYTTEHRLPFAYWFKLRRWLHASYFDPFGPDRDAAGAPVHDPYDHPERMQYRPNCMLCHNTYPYLYRLGSPAIRTGFPAQDLIFSRAAAASEIEKTVPVGAVTNPAYAARLDPDRDLVTLGVSCESCHFGGREHAREDRPMHFQPTSPALSIAPKDPSHKADDKGSNSWLAVSICTQCHSAAQDTFPNGAGVANSREALDLAAGSCSTKIKCTDCHDPHRPDERESEAVNPRHLRACTSCHERFKEPRIAAQHGGHPEATRLTCLDCHMPRIVQGLDNVTRSHTISTPTNPRMLAAGSANACSLCHLDRPISWTLRELERGWGKHIATDASWTAHYGERLERPVGQVWLASKSAPVRLLASQAYARSKLAGDALPDLIRALEDTEPVNRTFATFAVGRARGKTLTTAEYDPSDEPEVRRARIEQLLAQAARGRP